MPGQSLNAIIPMRILFLHKNFPGQFRNLISVFAQNPDNQVVFITENQTETLPGVIKLVYQPTRDAHQQTHRYVRQFEKAVLDA